MRRDRWDAWLVKAGDLESAIREFIEVHNEDPTPFVWTRTADQILASIAGYAQRTPRRQDDGQFWLRVPIEA